MGRRGPTLGADFCNFDIGCRVYCSDGNFGEGERAHDPEYEHLGLLEDGGQPGFTSHLDLGIA